MLLTYPVRLLKLLVVLSTALSYLVFSQTSTEANNTIIIGLDADMSAVAKEGGIAISRGAQLAINEINAQGGVLGKPLQLVIKDHRGNPARGLSNIQDLAALPNLAAVIGGVHTPVALAQLPAIHENRLIYLGAWAAGTAIVDNGYTPNYVFRASIRDAEAGEALVLKAKQQGASRIALALERTGWGRSNLSSITRAAQKHNIDITTVAWINWRQSDFSNEMKRIQESQAQALLLVTNAPEGAVILKHMLKQDCIMPIISHWGIAGGQFVSLMGLEKLNKLDVFTLQTFHFAGPTMGERANGLFEAYQAAFDATATRSSIPATVGVAQAYDLVHLLALAIKESGSINSQKVRESLLEIDLFKGAIKNYQRPFTPNSQDALLGDDYFMTFFDENGQLQPVNPM